MSIIVLVEDDQGFAEELIEFLAAHGLKTTWIRGLGGLIAEIGRIQPALVLLDQFVGDQDSLTLLGELRKTYKGGVVVLTGNKDTVDRIVALETGADDFVAKSLGPRELLARLRAVLRRVQPDPMPPQPKPAAAPSAGKWEIDMRRQLLVTPNGTSLRLTSTEFDALVFLSQNAGRLISRDELSTKLLNRTFTPLDRSVDNMLSRIRKAIEPHMCGEPAIRSVRGRGYMFMGFEDTARVGADFSVADVASTSYE